MTTLYEKIGGEKTIEQLVTVFYQNVLGDEELQPFFGDVSLDKLKKMQKAFFTLALDGPEPSLKISLFEAHRDRGIERKHLTRFTDHLVQTLSQIGVSEDAAMEIYQRIGTYSNEILGDATVDG